MVLSPSPTDVNGIRTFLSQPFDLRIYRCILYYTLQTYSPITYITYMYTFSFTL